VWADAFFHAGEENVVEFETLGAVERNERDAGFVFEGVSVANERAASRKSVKDSPASMLSATARVSSSRFSMRATSSGCVAVF